ncbi:heat shock protein transcriptional repressor HspR [Falsarthrobacter nasiphocae]|uniref:MerR family transcriptional regulator/heat shock protein HspR n=1 Tax=Falsarthrobacter nasiphocae TaxID=189863 RepID=A0AAE3YIC7_9MICC|nr:MerR family transcriptional regulator [Falsarthrobacter nasiphocae]MDR6892306.1 MerR family transcriptional regulator/heat shock protein HspR [Falsarthrobacter nasiphocae]
MAVQEEDFEPVFVISVAAELAEMHPQTLRQYDRLGIVTPQRQGGRHRRYSRRDVELLREVQRLSKEGVSLAGIKRVMELEHQVSALQSRVRELSRELEQERMLRADDTRVFAAGRQGEVVAARRGTRVRASRAVVLWRPGS